AALVTTMAKIAFTEAIRNESKPHRVLRRVNDAIAAASQVEDYLTAFLVMLEPDGRVRFAGAGHRPALVHRKATGSVARWDAPGILAGLFPSGSPDLPVKLGRLFTPRTNRLEPGDRLLLYTDGVIEAVGPDNDAFGEHRLRAALVRTSMLPIAEARDQVV